ncbi:MAG: DUF6077 domain-containing protein [Jatrophihabitans sp.]
MAAWWTLRPRAPVDSEAETDECDPRQPASVLAFATAAGLGVFSTFVFHADADDTFYVNRAQWVADHGTIATRDTMFGNQHLPAISGAGVPVSSIETLQGAIAHLAQIAAGSVAYLITPAVGTFLAVWAIWRLIRCWAPRRQAGCFVVAMVYLLWAGQTPATLGVFFLPRMQQGKAIFVAMLVPLIYLYLTRWVQAPTRRTAGYLVACGVAAEGLTSSATFVVPLLCAAVAIPLLLRREWRTAAGCFLPFGYPLGVGVVVQVLYESVNAPNALMSTPATLHFVFGASWFALIGWVGVLVAAFVVRRSAPVVGIAIVLLVVLAPGALAVMKGVIGAEAVLWRTMWVAPIAVCVGMLASVTLPARARWAAPIPVVILVAALIAAGTPFWAPRRQVSIADRPTWRYSAVALDQARAILRDDHVPGPVLAPADTSLALTILTTRLHAVSPYWPYTVTVVEPAAEHAARLRLARLMRSTIGAPTAAELRGELAILHVGWVCLRPHWRGRLALFATAGYSTRRHIRSAVCLQLPGKDRA